MIDILLNNHLEKSPRMAFREYLLFLDFRERQLKNSHDSTHADTKLFRLPKYIQAGADLRIRFHGNYLE